MAIFLGEPGLAGFTGAKDNGSGDDNCSYKMCKTPVKSSPSTNQHPTFYRPDALPTDGPTNSVGALKSLLVSVRNYYPYTITTLQVKKNTIHYTVRLLSLKNLENWSIFGRVIDNSRVSCFF